MSDQELDNAVQVMGLKGQDSMINKNTIEQLTQQAQAKLKAL